MLNNKEYLNKIFQSNKPLIIYKTIGGYDVYTDFKDKIVLNSKNFKNFLNTKTTKLKSNIKELNCHIGFFGFQLLCENIKVKLPKQKKSNSEGAGRDEARGEYLAGPARRGAHAHQHQLARRRGRGGGGGGRRVLNELKLLHECGPR